MIVIVVGLPGSGKSFFASRLARRIKAAYINSDRERKKMFANRTYSEKEKLSVYDAMLVKMKHFMKQNRNVVLDATFYKSRIREKFLAEVEGKAGVAFIEIRANLALTRERLNKQRPNSEADFTVYQKLKKQWEPLQEDHLILQSGNDNILEMLQEATEYLQIHDDKRTN